MKLPPHEKVKGLTPKTFGELPEHLRVSLTQFATKEKTMELFSNIVGWAVARNLIEGSNPKSQMLKLIEEVGELAGGIARGKPELIKDGIGDAVVVLTILAAQNGLKIEDCIAAAWDEIKDRKGRMQDGVFIKESEGL